MADRPHGARDAGPAGRAPVASGFSAGRPRLPAPSSASPPRRVRAAPAGAPRTEGSTALFGKTLREVARSRRTWVAVVATAGLAAAWAALASPASAAGTFNVRDYGATGSGSTNDTAAINWAILAASGAGGGTVVFPSGTYRSANTIHMLSNVTLQLDSGSTIMGASGTGYDHAESNPNSQYQDYGHSHFHNAMIWGNNLSNIGFTGSGTIDGGGHLITGNPGTGQADKIISLTRCKNLELSGVRLRRGGHFAALINGCDGVHSDHLVVDTASDRDGWNIINTQHVTITNINDAANDDALVFKSDWALGQRFPQGHVRVTNAHLSAGCCNALMFGSETCSDFTDYVFDTITITGASKSGLGMVSMDGANISDVHYRNITMTNVASPIMQKIGTRRRCGDSPGIGHISNITYDNVTGSGKGPFSPTLWGADSGHQPTNITFTNVNLTVPGGSANIGTGVPSNNATDYNPKSIGTRPAYGWYLHNVNGIQFTDSSVRFRGNDNRPAVIADAGSNVTFNRFIAQAGSGAPYDLRFQSINGYCVTSGTNTGGGALRVSQTGSTQSCVASDDFGLSVSPASHTVPSGGGTATYNVSTSVTSGTPGDVTLSASGLPAGATATFGRNPVPAGSSTTMTVTTTAATPDGTSPITVSGRASGRTHTALTSLTVGTNTTLTITGLTVSDTSNAADWSVQSNLRTGVNQYGDRTFTLTAVPSGLGGAQWIRTANDSKTSTVNPIVRFTVNKQVTVSVAVDSRRGRPSWMDPSWVDTNTHLTNSEPHNFEVFQKTFPAGQVSIGPNGDTANGSSMFTIVVQ